MQRRHLELDLLRSLAVILMIAYHGAYDLEHFFGIPVLSSIGIWDVVWARFTLVLFLLIVGATFSVTWERSGHRCRKYVMRGMELFACAMLVTLVTYIADPASYVRFGVLHMIAIAILLLPFLAPLREWSAVLGLGIIGISFLLPDSAHTWMLLPWGIPPADWYTVDYVPLIPWLGVPCMGYAVGYAVYIRKGFFREWAFSRFWKFLGFPGRYALPLYLIHQPVLVSGLAIIHRLFL